MIAPYVDTLLPGWRVVIDLPSAIGAIPAVAVGPAGVFSLEITDGSGVRTLADVPERGLIHAWAQAKHLERRRIGGRVTPLLALCDAAIDGPVGRRRGVHVLPLELVGSWLASRPTLLSTGEIDALHARLIDAHPAPRPALASTPAPADDPSPTLALVA